MINSSPRNSNICRINSKTNPLKQIPSELEEMEISSFFSPRDLLNCLQLNKSYFRLFRQDAHWKSFLPSFILGSVPEGQAKKYFLNLKNCEFFLLKSNATELTNFIFTQEKLQTWIMHSCLRPSIFLSKDIIIDELVRNLSCPILDFYLQNQLMTEEEIINLNLEYEFITEGVVHEWIVEKKISASEVLSHYQPESIRNIDCPFIMEHYIENQLTESEVIGCSVEARKAFEDGDIQRLIQYKEITPRQVIQSPLSFWTGG